MRLLYFISLSLSRAKEKVKEIIGNFIFTHVKGIDKRDKLMYNFQCGAKQFCCEKRRLVICEKPCILLLFGKERKRYARY